jgi:hypothetical protein
MGQDAPQSRIKASTKTVQRRQESKTKKKTTETSREQEPVGAGRERMIAIG